MKVISATRTKVVLRVNKGSENWKSFVFDIGIIPSHPTPRKIEIQKIVGAYLHTWSMPWRKFLRQTCIGDIVILEKELLVHNYRRSNTASSRRVAGRAKFKSKKQAATRG